MDLAIEQTLCIIKPDACKAQKEQEIMQLIELEGFHILEKRQILLTSAHVRDFYAEHLEKPFFGKLQSFMTSGTVWALVLAKNDAISAWRSMMGPTGSATAKTAAPGTIRALYGTDGTYNAVHGSDSPASAHREVKFFFPHRTAARAPSAPGGKVKIPATLEAALCKALTVLARDKPSQDPMAALAWLSDWLLNNNPSKPKIVAAQDLVLINVDDGSEFAPPGSAVPEETTQTTTEATNVTEDDSSIQQTLAMIKPDAVAATGAAQSIMSKIEAAGFTITRRRQYTLYPAQAEDFYAEHAEKPFFAKLVDFMTSGPIWALELQGAGAIKGWRTLMGPTNSLNAQLEAPDSIRAQFGTDGTRNATHGSDSPTSAEREISFHFPPQQKTLAMIKPDAVAAGAAQGIKTQIQAQGVRIVQQREYHMSREQAESFYKEHAEKQFFTKLVEFMTSGPIWALELEGLGAIAGWRAMMGPTDSSKAKASAPTTLRACFGTDGTKNAVHGSDSPASALREIEFHFSPDTADASSKPAAEAAPDSKQPEDASKSGEQVETVVVRPDESDVPGAEEEAAAVAVQAAERGRQARKQVEQMKQENSAASHSAPEDVLSPDSEPAAELPATDADQAPVDGNEGADEDKGADNTGENADAENTEAENAEAENAEVVMPAEAEQAVSEEALAPGAEAVPEEQEAVAEEQEAITEAVAAQAEEEAGAAEVGEVANAVPLTEHSEP